MKKALLLLLSGLLLSGCTMVLWERPYRFETIIGMYLAPEEDKLYALSLRHGYVFGLDDTFEQILVLSRSLAFSTELRDFALSKDNALSGRITLSINTDTISDLQETELIGLGFEESEEAENGLSYETHISGTSYCAIENVPIERFKEGIHVRIALPREAAKTVQNIALTPVAVATDAVVTVPSGVLMVLLMSMDSIQSTNRGQP